MDDPPFTPELLRLAYAHGYFPMPDPDTQEMMWFHPDPRAVLPLERFHVSRSLARSLKRPWEIRRNTAFTEVVDACAARKDTWINTEIKRIYGQLHAQGDAHSLEVWLDGALAGGVYGVSLSGAFFAESKFHRVTDASKVALYHLIQHMRTRGMTLLEVQFLTPHLQRLGATEIPRGEYMQKLRDALARPVSFV